ncbi:MAG: hypothetical protein J6P72_09095 [Firmicutes bacterium]|nr:hypothetical protein [Bacillota bacterium]
MNFTYLGTAAAEGWPAVFCNCPSCKRAEKIGLAAYWAGTKEAREIRTRSQSLVGEDLLIDLPPDTYLHKLRENLDLTKVKYLLITHKHMDHFYPQELTIRGSGYSHDMVNEDLHIYCAQETMDYFYLVSGWELDKASDRHLHWHVLSAFQPVQAGPYWITPLPASHMKEGNEPFLYHIEKEEDGRNLSILYLHDSGYYKDEVWDYFEKTAKDKGPVTMVSFDSTSGDKETDHGGHMGFSEVFRVKDRMEKLGIIGKETICCMNHFSHNGHYSYDEMAALASPHGCLVSYDGMKLAL